MHFDLSKRLKNRYPGFKLGSTFSWFLIIVFTVGYAIAFPWLQHRFGPLARGFSFSFICVAALTWGLRGGVLVGFLAAPFNWILYWVHDLPFTGGPVGIILAVSIAAIIGRVKDLSVRLEEELHERKIADRELSRYKVHLEELVEKRTAELSRLATAISQVGEVIVITDTDGKIQYANPAFSKVTGYAEEEYVGKKPNILQSGHQDEAFYRHLWSEITQGKVWTGQIVNKKKDGTLFREEATISPVRDTFGEIVNYVAVKRDITREFELEKMVRQTQKMEAIGTLAGGIAHDFNNILSAIVGYTELSMMHLDKASQSYKYLEKVLQACERARDLVQQILTFSRQTEQELKPVQTKLVVKEVLKLLRASLPATIDIQQTVESDAQVLGDPTQVHQIMMNLCTNAGYAMREEGGTLTVVLENLELDADSLANHGSLNPGPYVVLTIGDTGQGMSSEVLEKIFDPFYTTKEKGEGTGMGLSVVHGIVKSYGGDIYAYSEAGRGSTFKVFLPAIERRVEPESREERKIPTGTETILFVDDEQPLADIGKELLESLGYKVTIRTSSIDAVEQFRVNADKYDLVITDMTMPNLTGEELARNILTIRPDIPIILCTGFSSAMTEKSALAVGIRALVMKPILKKQIGTTIRSVLDEPKEM